MKLISTILSILITFLSLLPCDDVKVIDNCDQEIQFHNDNDNDHSNTDDCSPFCLCQCCHTPVVIFSPYYFNTAITLYSNYKQLGYYQSLILNILLYPIWNPPKIS